ncbi:hypothetical protein BA895_19905 [Humibacillus sp. DSM 29435]|nr:hypothetical protein BA895_19905 [Humibacillus sp. DSM 29435]
MTCPKCTKTVSAAGACGGCGFEVPPHWLTDVQCSMAVTGARSAGKSIFIGVMIRHFGQFLADRHHTFLTPLNDTEDRFLRTYENYLYGEEGIIPPTPPDVPEPLMWSFTMGGRRFCLSLADAAGESFERLTPDQNAFAYLGGVDMICSLIDPLKVSDVRAIVRDTGIPLPAEAGNDLQVLRRVLQARAAHAIPGRVQVLALTISKFDVLQGLKNVDNDRWVSIMGRPGAAMQRDPSYVTQWDDPQDRLLLSQELRSLLPVLGAPLIEAAATESGLPYYLYAVSALGRPPGNDGFSTSGISPYRVLDPLKTLLTMKAVQA